MNRRHFLMTSAAAAGALSTKGLASANDTVRVACVGIRGQGNSHIREYSRMQNVEIAALCDVDENVLNKRLQEVARVPERKSLLRSPMFASCSKINPSTPFRLPHPTTGTRWIGHMGPVRQARTFTSRSPARTTFLRAAPQLVAASQKYNQHRAARHQ